MADSDQLGAKGAGQFLTALQRSTQEMVRQQRVAAKLTQSLDEASNAAQDKAVEALEQLAKQSSLLEDSIKKEIAARKQTPKSILQVNNRIEAIGEKIIDAQTAYHKATKDAKAEVEKHKKVDRNSSAAERKAKADALRALRALEGKQEKALQKIFTGLGITVQNATKSIDKYAADAVRHKESMKKVDASLSTAGAKIGKSLDQVRSKVVTNIESFGKLSVVVDLARRAVTELYGQSIRLANRGLIGSMAQMNISALKLRMTAEEFETVIGANRDMVALLGGGAQGVARFEQVLTESSVGLEYLGKEGKKAAATIISTFNRAGYGLASSNADVARAFKMNIKDINRQFKLFQGAFGDTAEQFAALYEGQLQSEALQAKLLSADKQDYNLQLREIMVRTENLKLMGLNNDQILAMSKKVDGLFNPKKNRQSEAITQRLYAREAMLAGSRVAREQDAGLADRIDEFVRSGEFGRVQAMSTEDKKNYLANNPAIAKDIARMVEIQSKIKDQSGGDTSFQGYVFTDMMERAAGEFSWIADTGRNLLQAKAQGHDQTPEGMQKRREEAYANTLSDVNGKTTLLGQSFGLLRDSVDSVTAVMNNPFTTALGAFGAGLLFASKTVRGAATSLVGHVANVAKSLGNVVARAGNFIVGTGKMMMSSFVGLFKGIWAFMKKIPGLTIAISALETAVDVARTDTEEYEERFGLEAGNTFLGNVGVRLAGAVTDLGANFAKGLTLGAWDPSKNFADKQRKEREATTPAPMQSTRPEVATRQPGRARMPNQDILTAINEASRTGGVDRNYMLAMAAQESAFDPNARASTSSAKGLYQFIDGTWGEMVKKYGEQYGIGINDQFDPKKNALMGALFTRDNGEKLKRAGFEASGQNLYGAHFLGAGGAVNMLNAGKDAIAAEVNPAAARANPSVFYDKDGRARTVSELFEFFNKKVGSKTDMYAHLPKGAQQVAGIMQPTPQQTQIATPVADPLAIDRERRAIEEKLRQQRGLPQQETAPGAPVKPIDQREERTNPVLAELQKHTAILQQIATMTGRQFTSASRGYQLDQQSAINLGA